MKNLLISTILTLTACGSGTQAEAAPKDITIRFAVIADAVNTCDEDLAFQAAARVLRSTLPSRMPRIRARYDLFLPNTGPELSLARFWDKSLLYYWAGQIGVEQGSIRAVLSPPLETPQGRMYGGWSLGTCVPHAGFLWMNVEQGNTRRNAGILLHEVGHQLGARDLFAVDGSCSPNGHVNEYAIMCGNGGQYLRDTENPEYCWISKTQIRACLTKKFKALRSRGFEEHFTTPMF